MVGGIRQGNENDEVDIYTYVTEQTFDSYLFQLVETKQKFISQIMTSKTPVRSAEDVDKKALSYAEIKALAAGNPLILEKTELDIDVAKLKLLKQNHLSQIYRLEDLIVKDYPNQIAKLESKISSIEKDIQIINDNTNTQNTEKFSPMILKDTQYSKKEQAGMELLEICKNKQGLDAQRIGKYRGMNMFLELDISNYRMLLKLKNNYTYQVELGDDIYGNITRIDNSFKDIDFCIKQYNGELEDVKRQLETAKVEVQKPFTRENELKEKMEELDKINISLNINEKEKQVLDTSDSDELENDDKNNDRER